MSIQAAELIEKIELFNALTEKERAMVVAGGRVRPFANGAVICKEGDRGTTFYGVVRGHLDVQAGWPALLVDRLGPGQYFGEMSVLTGEPRTATVKAATDCELLELDRGLFFVLFSENLALIDAVTDAVTTRNANRAHKTRKSGKGSHPSGEVPAGRVDRIDTPEPSERAHILSRVKKAFGLG